MEKTVMTEFLERKQLYDAESQLLQELEKKPMTEGQIKDMLTRGYSDLETAKMSHRFEELVIDLRARGLVVDDTPLSYTEFKKVNPGVITMRQSTFYQMQLDEYDRFKNALEPTNRSMLVNYQPPKQWKVYEDLPMDKQGQHGTEYVYHYKYGNKLTGNGWKVVTNLISSPLDVDDRSKVGNAERLYQQARNEIASIFNDLEIPVTPEADRQ